MDKKKLIILILVVIGVLTIMMFGAGAYRSKNDSPPRKPEENSLAKLIEGATGWMRADFDRKRMRGCGYAGGRSINVANSCTLTIRPGSARPSDFKLKPTGLVAICFAFSSQKLEDCIKKGDMRVPEDPPAKFTVAKDSAFLYLQCVGASNCGVTLD